MPYVDERGGIDLGGDDPWKGYPVAIVERVARVVHECVGVQTISPGTGIVRDLGLDSLDLWDFEFAIQSEFAITFDYDQDSDRIVTLGDLVQLLKDRTG
jgi:acyl carrier protein